jgi:hypothetical protein
MIAQLTDSLGPIPIPDPPVIAAFPLKGDFGGGIDLQPPLAVHLFDQPGLKTEQRFLLAQHSVRRFRFAKNHLSCTEYDELAQHWQQAQGAYAQFNYTAYEPGKTETVMVRYETPAITFDYLVALIVNGPGITFLEIPSITPAYTSVAQLVRFPDDTLSAALTAQDQTIIPLLTITPRNGGTPIYLSNQRLTLDGQLYLPRLIDWSGVSQSIGENADAASFNFGNADLIWTQYVNKVNLYAATVSLSMFHVQSQYRVDLWTGAATNWAFDTSGKFQINASDGTFYLTLNYPSRKILRTCWKVYRGRFCPASASNGFPDCPKDYDSCVARGVPHSFGGIVVPPQSVKIMDNSTGVFGFGRSTMTSVTVTDDTIYQRPLQEIYTDEQMLVTVDTAAGRDESDFYAALGIVGEGPISNFDGNLILSTLDGQPPHDPLHDGGFRAATGTDPSGQYDFIGISQADPATGLWGNPFTGVPYIPPGSTYCGGIAFAEIRRTDPKGLQLSAVSDHTMIISLLGGIGGWVWNGPGERVWVTSLANTVWVAINVYLRGLGMRCDNTNADLVSPATMEAFFDVEAAMEAAAICDTVVPKLIGTGNELQFPFRGCLKEAKPLRDWLREILNGCLGYSTFVNGKLWIGIRVNSSVLAGNAYTRASILFRTLMVSPLQPQFNWLVGNFGDEEFGWQLNNVTIYDIDHASFLGTPDSPQYLVQTVSFIGISNKSQCARVVTTRLREEIGGIVQSDGVTNEQPNARNFQFQTTVLGLTTKVGDIVSMTDPTMPGGYAEGRVTGWSLNPDWSISIQASCTFDDMYDSVVGPKPVDVPAAPVPIEALPSATGLTWMPNYIAPVAGDPLYPDTLERTFDIWQDYSITKDGNWQAALYVEGEFPVNSMGSGAQPRITGWELAAGGNLNGPMTVYVAIVQLTSSGQPLYPSNMVAMWIPHGVTGQQMKLTVALSADGLDWNLYAGNDRRTMGFQAMSGPQTDTAINFTGPIHEMTAGMPETAAVKVGIAAKHSIHSGRAGMTVTGVTGPNQIQSNDFIGSTDNWVGPPASLLSVLAKEGVTTTPLWNFTVTAFDGSTGTMTVTPDCVRLDGGGNVDPAQSVQPGDVLIVRHVAMSVSTDGLTVTDPLWDNFVALNQFNSAGLRPGAEKGNVYRILLGTGAGQWRNITDNTSTSITVSQAWSPLPDQTSVMIVEEPSWSQPSQTSAMTVTSTGTVVQIRMEVANLRNEVALVKGFIIDNQGLESDESVAPMRELFVFGQPPTVRVVGPDPGPWDSLVTDQTIRFDTSGGNDVTVQLLPIAEYQGRTLYFSNDNGPNNGIVQCATGEFLFDGNSSVTLAPTETSRLTAG